MALPNTNQPGEHLFEWEGGAGISEGILTIPEGELKNKIAFLGHPHSLHGGTMNNKVVTTMARAFKEAGIPSLRFNFRGVGRSEGDYDDGIGESRDMLALVTLYLQDHPNTSCIFAGFSFGSYVAYRAAAEQEHTLLLTIAPPVHHYNFREYDPIPSSWLIIQGDKDEFMEPSLIYTFANSFRPPIPVIRCKDASHFFHGKLLDLKSIILENLPS